MPTMPFARLAVVPIAVAALAAAPASSRLTIRIADYLTMPMTGEVGGTENIAQLARVNFMRPDPADANRFFVNDLNGPLYILDRTTKALTTYLDFNGRDRRTGLFHRFTYAGGYANGLISFQFDPDYAKNGRFYTIHLEDPSTRAPPEPDGTSVPGLNLADYTVTSPEMTPGAIQREAVLIEWTDTNVADAVFEGTARELLRVPFNTRIHPMGDLIFNPTARRGDAEWGVLYVACGDGGSGEQQTDVRSNPQRLDTLVGKILRIIPDPSAHTATSTVSPNGRYRIPNTNPFATVKGARKEIWAYGFRNVHRLTWDVNPANRADNHLIAAVIGLHTWESVDIIHRGANYGYSMREGDQVLKPDNTTTKLPAVDLIPVRVTDTIVSGRVHPMYPVIVYPHTDAGGDAIAGGVVYRGTRLPALRGKYIFGDITTGKIWYADVRAMLAADDGRAETGAAMHEVNIAWDEPNDAPDAGVGTFRSMFPIVKAAYHARGGTDPDLPGSSTVSGRGRADIRFAVDPAGELYILSKSDGMIRAVTGIEEAAHVTSAVPARN